MDLHTALGGYADAELISPDTIPGPLRPAARAAMQAVLHHLPAVEWRRLSYQERLFACAILPSLLRDRFAVLHFSELALGRMLQRFRSIFRLRYRLLFSNGAPAPPFMYARFDHIQLLTPLHVEEAIRHGLPPEKLSLVPYGVDCEVFRPGDNGERTALRRELGIPEESFVVFTAAALKSSHKRIDTLLRAAATLPKEIFLFIAGAETTETASLRRLADELLPDRCRMVSLPHEAVARMYRAADVFVLPSMIEGLPIVTLEAMASGLQVIAHRSPLFEWIVGDADDLADMSDERQLASAISRSRNDSDRRHAAGVRNREHARATFDWRSLRDQYLRMYEACAQ